MIELTLAGFCGAPPTPSAPACARPREPEVRLLDRSPAAPHAPQQRFGPRGYNGTVTWRERITFDPQVMGGRPCIRGMRITVGTILTLLRHQTPEEILRDYPYLEREDIDAALEYAAYLADEREVAV